MSFSGLRDATVLWRPVNSSSPQVLMIPGSVSVVPLTKEEKGKWCAEPWHFQAVFLSNTGKRFPVVSKEPPFIQRGFIPSDNPIYYGDDKA